jgi:hypothetical protein
MEVYPQPVLNLKCLVDIPVYIYGGIGQRSIWWEKRARMISVRVLEL